jgi:hypothetical protein
MTKSSMLAPSNSIGTVHEIVEPHRAPALKADGARQQSRARARRCRRRSTGSTSIDPLPGGAALLGGFTLRTKLLVQ